MKSENEWIYENKFLEFYESGDGVEWELWIDQKTKKIYKVTIEIVRDFSDMEEVSSYHEAKFGKHVE